MYSKFPFSMENIPRQRSFGCLSLKFGCIFSALICILYALLALSQCIATLLMPPSQMTEDELDLGLSYGFIITVTLVHTVSFVLSAVMLLGALREKAGLIRPWVVWKSLQIIAAVLLFVLSTTNNFINHFDNTTLLFYVIEFLSILIRFYMLMLVASFYKQLVEDKEECRRLRSLVDNDTWYTEA